VSIHEDVIKDILRRAAYTVVALRNDWDIETLSMYDEEGIEGWRWVAPNGVEYVEIGSWDEFPEVPEAVEEMLHPLLPSEVKEIPL
jgi:hypothetical protein